MKTISLYQVLWHTEHASDVLSEVMTSKREAEKLGAQWFRDMIGIDNNPREAREEYDWEVVGKDFYAVKAPGNCWSVYTQPPNGIAIPILTHRTLDMCRTALVMWFISERK